MANWSIPQEWIGEPTFIIGGGPSIQNLDFDRLRGRARVIAVNNAGITRATWADVLFWADTRWLLWNADQLDNFKGKYLVTRKQPFQRLDLDIKYLDYLGGSSPRLSKRPTCVGGWCGGSSAINLAHLFGSRQTFLFGFDMTPGNWHTAHRKDPVPGQHRNKFVPTLEAMAIQLAEAGHEIYNTNPRSALRCFPFIPIEELLAMDDLTRLEREKYLAVWQRAEYRRISPGLLECERAWLICGMKPGHSLIDFGSGPCRATKNFQDRGMIVQAIDFAPNAREHFDVPFLEACLWELPDGIEQADFGYCCDVMEHIPESKIDDVLSNIARLSSKAAYFRIATRPDAMGPRLIGMPLHVTINAGEWWRRRVERHFAIVDVIEENGRDIMMICRQ